MKTINTLQAIVVGLFVCACASTPVSAAPKQIEAKFLYVEDAIATFQTDAGDYVISPMEEGSFTERYVNSPGFKEGKRYLLTYEEGVWIQEVGNMQDSVKVQRLSSATLLN